MIEINNLTIAYYTSSGVVYPIQDLSLSISSGTSSAFVGESGCGKTTLALALMHLLPSNAKILSGSIHIDGKNIFSLTQEEKKFFLGKIVAMILQDPLTALNPTLSIQTQLLEAVLYKKLLTKKEALERAVELLHDVGLNKHFLKRYPHELSGGERQRVLIALSLMCHPKILIADEPTTALDILRQQQICTLLNKVQKKYNLTLIIISHDLRMISHMADTVFVFYAGSLVEKAPSFDIFHFAKHPYTKLLLQALPNKSRKKLYSIPGTPPSLLEKSYSCPFKNRCPMAIEKCNQKPALCNLTTNHQSLCWQWQEC